MAEKVYLNGKIVSRTKAMILGFNPASLSGCGLFETMRVYGGQPFRLKDHLQRLRRSSPLLGIKPPSFHCLRGALQQVIEVNHLKEAVVRLNVLMGSGGTDVFIFTRKLRLPTATQVKKGYAVALYDDERREASFLNNLKTLDRSFYESLSERGRADGADEVLFLNEAGCLVEGTRTNLFCVTKGRIATPALFCGCLEGVTRSVVIKLSKRLRIGVSERCISSQELFLHDAVFLTNSLLGVMAVSSVNGRRLSRQGRPIVEKIDHAYKEEVEKECGIM